MVAAKYVPLKVQGHIDKSLILDGLSISNFTLIQTDSLDTLITAEHIGASLHWSSLFRKNAILSHLTLRKGHVFHPLWNYKPQSRGSYSTPNLIFRKLAVDSFVIDSPADRLASGLTLEHYRGSGWLLDGILYLKTDTAALALGAPLNQTVQFSGGISLEPNRTGQLIDLGILLANGKGVINAGFQPDSISAQVHIPSFNLKDLLRRQGLRLPLDSAVLKSFNMAVSRNNGIWLASGEGISQLNTRTAKIKIDQARFDSSGLSLKAQMQSGIQKLQTNFSLANYQNFTLTGSAEKLDMSQDFSTPRIRDLSGKFSVSGTSRQQTANVRLEAFRVGAYRIDTLVMKMTRESDQYRIDSLAITTSGTKLNLHGMVQSRQLTLTGDVRVSDISQWVPNREKVPLAGSTDLKFRVAGSISEPVIQGEIQQAELTYGQRIKSVGRGKFNLKKRHSVWDGELVLHGSDGLLLNDTLRNLNIALQLENNRLRLTNFNARSDRYLIAGSGLATPDSLILQRLSIILDNQSLSTAEPVKIYHPKRRPNQWVIPRRVLTFNRGGVSVEGNFSADGEMDLNLTTELISMSEVMKFLGRKTVMAGNLAGNFHISGQPANPTIESNFTWMKPAVEQLSADNFVFQGKIQNRKLIVASASFTKGSAKVSFLGTFPLGFTADEWKESRTENQLFTARFTDYKLKDLAFTHYKKTPVSGTLTGIINGRGTPAATILKATFDVQNGMWGKLDFNKGRVGFSYERGIINVDTIGVISNWGIASGMGYLSGDLNLRPETRRPPGGVENPLDLTFTGNFSQLKFLTAYLNGLDELTGDFDVDMHLYGTYENPIRDMKLRGHHATLAMSFLDNKITDIHTEMTMRNNTMTIDHFSGKMNYTEGTALEKAGGIRWATRQLGSILGFGKGREYKGDLLVTGVGDFSQFFHPKFNIGLKGKEIYYRNIASEFEAISDLNMTIAGQDTIRINADMPVIKGGYFSNFTSQESYNVKKVATTQLQHHGPVVIYNLHTTFLGNLRIENNLMFSEWEGELWLLNYGDGKLRFSGSLTVLAGGKFFYLGNVLDIQSGTLTFNPVEFNPEISDFVVTTTIDGEQVYLSLSGDLKEPQLALAPGETTTLSMDDILAYLTINQKVTQGINLGANSLRDPVRSYVGMLVNKQGEKLLNRFMGLDYLDIQSSLFDPSASDTARITIGQRLSKNIKMTYQRDIMISEPNPYSKLSVEYRMNKNMSIIGGVDQDGLLEVRGRLRYTY